MKNTQAIFDYLYSKYGISRRVLRSKTRKPNIVEVRHIGMFILRIKLEISFKEIGEIFDRDHSTASHAYKKIAGLIETDKLKLEDIDASDINFHAPTITIDDSLDEALRIFKVRFKKAFALDPHGMMIDVNKIINKRLKNL